MGFKIPEKYLSRKFIVALATLLAIVTGLGEGNLTEMLILAGSYIGGQGVVDAVAASKAKK